MPAYTPIHLLAIANPMKTPESARGTNVSRSR